MSAVVDQLTNEMQAHRAYKIASGASLYITSYFDVSSGFNYSVKIL